MSCVDKKDADDYHAPKANSKPSAAGSSWKGGAKERNAVLRRPPKGTALKRSGADFAPTCLSLTKKMRAIFGEVRDLYANLDNVAFLCQRLKI